MQSRGMRRMPCKKALKYPLTGLSLALILFLPLVIAQPGPTPGYTVLGRVSRADGSAAAGSFVVVTQSATQESFTATANETGWYVVYNIGASVGDELDITASSGKLTGQGTTTITATSPLYEVNITLTESDEGAGFPFVWLIAIAGVIILAIMAALLLRGGKAAAPPVKRRRK
jgi:hypothetical protein